MTPSNTPQRKKAPVKRGRPATGFDKNHEFLLHCLTHSDARIDYAAVGKCEGMSEKQALRRFYWLKAQISSMKKLLPVKTQRLKSRVRDKG